MTRSDTREPGEGFSPARSRRAAVASLVGTLVEWYDYYIFGTASVLVFDKQFFPTLSPVAGTLAALATFGVAFFARPVGAAIFGHFGDRVSRKQVLVWSVVAMGTATVLVGALPNYGAIGVWAPILLVLARLIQGVAVGGEWSGAVLMALENAPAKRRAFFASWPQASAPAATVLSSLTFFFIEKMPDADLQGWGWRLPFFFSAVLVGIGLYVRLKLTDTVDFQQAKDEGRLVRVPVSAIFRRYKTRLLVGMLAGLAPNIVFYTTTVFSLSYGPKIGVDSSVIFVSLIVSCSIQVVAMPAWAVAADRFDKRTMLLIGSGGIALLGFPFFLLFDVGRPWAVIVAFVVALPMVHSISYGVLSSFTAELFPAEVRFTGTGLSYQLGGIITSAPVPFLAAFLLDRTGTVYSVAAYVAIAAVLGAVVVALSRLFDRRRNRPGAVPGPVAPVTNAPKTSS
ncbi:MAG TPA: MFS transporter [Amycolatopsis sp.]|nr:MFS transporter [Amycolatopsis sp.]